MNLEKSLKDWIIRHIKQRDIFFKKIQNINDFENYAKITYKDYTVIIIGLPSLKTEILNLANENKKNNLRTTIAVLNTKENITWLMKNWNDAEKIEYLCIYFINPISSKDTKWIIIPHTHHKITEKKALKIGLSSLSQNVDIIPEPYEKHLKDSAWQN